MRSGRPCEKRTNSAPMTRQSSTVLAAMSRKGAWGTSAAFAMARDYGRPRGSTQRMLPACPEDGGASPARFARGRAKRAGEWGPRPASPDGGEGKIPSQELEEQRQAERRRQVVECRVRCRRVV